MHDLTYKRMRSEDDVDIPELTAMHQIPEIVRYLSISENYFRYVTNSENVYFYKVYDGGRLIGSTHLEKQGTTLFMDILVFPEFQRAGVGTKIVKDVQNDVFGLRFERIEVSVDERNTASLRLFENEGFIRTSEDDGLIYYAYQREPL